MSRFTEHTGLLTMNLIINNRCKMEIVNSKQEPSELQENLYLLIEYCINNNVGFRDGETLKINMIYM